MNVTAKWDVDPRNFITTVRDDVTALTNELAEEIFDGVVDKSPVDTGSFRASWNASVDQPVFNYVVGGNSQSPIGPPSYPRIKAQFGESIHITNGAPYAGRLENGWSGQAPLGVVAVTLAGL